MHCEYKYPNTHSKFVIDQPLIFQILFRRHLKSGFIFSIFSFEIYMYGTKKLFESEYIARLIKKNSSSRYLIYNNLIVFELNHSQCDNILYGYQPNALKSFLNWT